MTADEKPEWDGWIAGASGRWRYHVRQPTSLTYCIAIRRSDSVRLEVYGSAGPKWQLRRMARRIRQMERMEARLP